MTETIKTDNNKENLYMSTKSKDTHSYKEWLNSDFFWKRAFAIMGYVIAATIVVDLVVFIIIFPLSFL